MDFLSSEIADAGDFSSLTRESYLTDSGRRRNVERWIENIVNASIDIAKVLLASVQTRLPQTYREIFLNLGTLQDFDAETAENLSRFSRLRNILAPEYLDTRWARISAFIREAVPYYHRLLAYVSQILPRYGLPE